MSKYSINQTVLREEKYLVEALKEMGYEVEVRPEGASLNSYYSDQEAKIANIIIRRDQLRGAYGDVGFVRQPDGQLATHAGFRQCSHNLGRYIMNVFSN